MPHSSHVSRIFKTGEAIDQTEQGNQVIAGLTASALVFTTPTVTVAAFTIINNTYKTKITAASGGDSLLIQQRDDYRDLTWIPAMESNAVYVESVAAGNGTTIVMSGYHATKTTFETHVRPVAMLLKVEGASTGAVDFSSTTKVDAHSFTIIAGKAGDLTISETGDHLVIKSTNDVIIFPSTLKRGQINGLTRGVEMDFYIVADNAAGLGPLYNKGNVIVP